MKHRILSLVIVCLNLFSISVFAQTNYPLPQNPDTLRILCIGNSFTDDGMMYLPELLEAAGIKNVILGRLYIGGCSLEGHCIEDQKAPGEGRYIYYKSTENKWEPGVKGTHLHTGIEDENWDIVVLQQQSGKSGWYMTYQPWLNQLIEIVRMHCSNAGACIAWQQTWSYANTSKHGEFSRYGKSCNMMYQSIINCNKQLMEDTQINVIIPSGTTVQNLRETAMADSLQFTRDGFHLDYKMGRYAAACAWFQTLVAPVLKTNLAGNPCRLAGTEHALTDEQALACQLAARQACARLFEVTKSEQ